MDNKCWVEANAALLKCLPKGFELEDFSKNAFGWFEWRAQNNKGYELAGSIFVERPLYFLLITSACNPGNGAFIAPLISTAGYVEERRSKDWLYTMPSMIGAH